MQFFIIMQQTLTFITSLFCSPFIFLYLKSLWYVKICSWTVLLGCWKTKSETKSKSSVSEINSDFQPVAQEAFVGTLPKAFYIYTYSTFDSVRLSVCHYLGKYSTQPQVKWKKIDGNL